MSQLRIFLLCAVIGVTGGALYDLLFLLFSPWKKRAAGIARDLLFCLLFLGWYLFCSLALGLPRMRLYLFAGCLAGFFLYLKSFHKTVAFLSEKLYNKIKARKPKKRKHCLWRERGIASRKIRRSGSR